MRVAGIITVSASENDRSDCDLEDVDGSFFEAGRLAGTRPLRCSAGITHTSRPPPSRAYDEYD